MVIAILPSNNQVETPIDHREKDLQIKKTKMTYSIADESFNIFSQRAKLDLNSPTSLHFHGGVDVVFEKMTLNPSSLIIDQKDKSMLIHHLKIEGASDIFFKEAQVSPKHNWTIVENLCLEAPYPFISFTHLNKLHSDVIKTQLKSLQLIQERNKKAKQQKNTQRQEKGGYGKPLNTTQHQKVSTQKFTLESDHVESPLGRLNLRLKLKGVKFQVDGQTIQSNFAKFQSSQSVLTFYGKVVLNAPSRVITGDYASLNLGNGKLDINQISTSFPLSGK